MKHVQILLLLLGIGFFSKSQIAGRYTSSGYFFHPIDSRAINLNKSIISRSNNRYQVEVGDLGGTYVFTFEIDANNHLVNWSTEGSTPPSPASSFMTTDNPGSFTFPAPIPPGTAPYLHSTYNNTYDPVSKIFYLHYGYNIGGTSESSYTRQVYEVLTLIPKPQIFSFSPDSGTVQTQINITGTGFSRVNPYNGISFGSVNADSATIVSDSVITAWVGSGNTGVVTVGDGYEVDSLLGFTYTMPPPAAISPWQYLGAAGFSPTKADWVNMVLDKHDIPYVVFTDSVDGRAKVKKYNGSWQDVGGVVSDGRCSKTKIALDTAGNPIVAYIDSANGGYVIVKKFDGSSWTNLIMPLRIPARYFALLVDTLSNIYIPVNAQRDTSIAMNKYSNGTWLYDHSIATMPWDGHELSMAVGKNNVPYIMYVDHSLPANRGRVSVKRLTGTSWQYVGSAGFSNLVNSQYCPSISVDTAGNPLVSFIDDSTFQRISVYKFNGSNWNNDEGRSFSKSRSFFPSVSVDNKGVLSVVFIDGSYNNQGTVLTFNKTNSHWKTTGNRGFLPSRSLEVNAMATGKNNAIYIAFSDVNENGRVSVVKLVKDFIWTGAVSQAWENPANWSTGEVPNAAANVFINDLGIVVLSSYATVNSITLSPTASFTILPSATLTILGP